MLVSVVLLGLRLFVGEAAGWRDTEALHAALALFRQASYLDHPGLIGWLSALLAGADGVPDPVTAHRFTAAAATGIPWIGALAARAAGASWRGALVTVLALLLAPMFAVGLFGFTPHVPLAFAWIAALACAALALRNPPSSVQAFAGTLGAGLFTGVAIMSEASGFTLAVALVAAWLSRSARPRLKTTAPYFAALVAAVAALPFVLREAGLRWPMLYHSLGGMHASFGLLLRNLAALVGGQLLFLSPFVLFVAALLAVDLGRTHRRDDISRLLFYATVIPFGVLGLSALFQRDMEPQALAPAYLALAVQLARRSDDLTPFISRRLMTASLGTAAATIAFAALAVMTPLLPKVMGRRYDAKYDATNDMFVWNRATDLLDTNLTQAEDLDLGPVVVVGPHWTVCAQLQAHFGSRARVGCMTAGGDDFDTFYPRSVWEDAKVIVYVTDDRFPMDANSPLPNRAVQSVDRVTIRRGGVPIRTLRVMRLGRLGAA